MTTPEERLVKIFRDAAKSALFSWHQNSDGLDELASDLWVRFLESPASMKKLEDAPDHVARRMVYKAALQILAGSALTEDEFRGNNLYSPENIKAALEGTPRNKFLMLVLPKAMDALGRQNEEYAEAIRVRYEDGVIPTRQTAEQVKLSRALKSLTEHVNILTIEAGGANNTKHPGPKLRAPIDPDVRSSGGIHSDPTASIALALMENKEMRDEFYQEGTLTEFLEGKGHA